jgi:AraC-like DNA-binding protein
VITLDSALTNPVDSFSKHIGIHQLTALILAIMSLALLFFPQVLYGMPNYSLGKNSEIPKIEKIQSNQLTVNNTDNPSRSDYFNELAARIIQYMESVKPYTDEDFSIENISKALNVPINHIMYCLNEILKTKFTTMRMNYRVNYAKELLGDEKNQHFTIEAIAQKCGFSSRSTFYAAFKEITKITPKEYIVNLKK